MLESENPQNLVEEPQIKLNIGNQLKEVNYSTEDKSHINVLSLFSGCGGMDLGFEGGFSVLNSSVNENILPNVIKKDVGDNFIELNETKFKTVFANDILNEAKITWSHYFSKKDKVFRDFSVSSIVDLVKLQKNNIKVFPENADIVKGGFPCQDFSVSGKRNGFYSTISNVYLF